MKAVLFDMDGVLVDVSASYREAIRQTVVYFSGREIMPEEIQQYKNAGGWNDDWALTEKILADRDCRISLDRIIRVFQEIYLGENFSGLICAEKWLLNKAVLDSLRKNFRLGVVTGRPGKEAGYALKRFGMSTRFSVCITRDDVPEGMGKPHPFGLIKALTLLDCREGYYVGDTVDDIKAAIGSGLIPIGVVPGSGDEASAGRRLRETGALSVLSDINRIEEVLK